jgi:hypothetical protein
MKMQTYQSLEASHGWVIQPSFKYDVFHFIWSISEHEQIINRWYPKEMAEWRARLSPDALNKLDELTDWDNSGVSQSLMGTLFSVIEADTIDEIIQALRNNDEIMKMTQLKMGMPPQEPYCTMLIEVLNSIKIAGFEEYWYGEIEPIVQQQCNTLYEFLIHYSADRLLSAIDEFVKQDKSLHVPTSYVYLTYFSYALGYRVSKNTHVQSFQPGKPINTRQFVRTAIHEILHGFQSTPILDCYIQNLRENDSFFAATLPKLSHWGEGDWENIIEAGEAYISSKLGLCTSEELKEHLKRQYDGALVLAQVIYHYLLSRETDLASLSYNDFLIKLFDEGVISTGNLENQYRTIL